MRRWPVVLIPLLFLACSDSRPVPGPGANRNDASARDGGFLVHNDAGPTDDAASAADAAPPGVDAAPGLDASPTADAAPPAADASPTADAAPVIGLDALPVGLDATPGTDATPAADGGVVPPTTYVESTIPATNWIDACAMGVTASLSDPDDGHTDMPTPLPFAFTFFGSTVTAVWASTNGYATFDVEPIDSLDFPFPILDEGATILPLWEDLVLDGPTSAVCIATVGAAPNRQLVIEWRDAMSYNASDETTLTFELVLNEGTNSVDFVYNTLIAMPGDEGYVDGTEASIGLQSPQGLDFVAHPGMIGTTTGIRFTP